MGITWKNSEYVCIHCGGPIADGLGRLGSVLCHDCRADQGVDALLTRPIPKLRPSRWRAGMVRRVILTIRRR
jgi:hypothetical protein